MTEGVDGRREELKASPPEVETQGGHINAMDKIRDEMASTKNGAVAAVGEIVTELLMEDPSREQAILNKDKTLQGAFDALTAYAKKQPRSGNCVYVPPGKAREVICEYFGIEATKENDLIRHGCAVPPSPKGEGKKGTSSDLAALGHLPQRGKAEEADPFDLDALMGVL